MTDHILKATCSTVHLGGFSPHLTPAITVNSGDSIQVETYTGFYVIDQAPPEFLTPEFIEICQSLPADRKVGAGPHLLTGPIYIKDATPGDVLEIRLEQIYPRLPIGFNMIRPGWGALPQQFPDRRLRFIPLNLEKGVAELAVRFSDAVDFPGTPRPRFPPNQPDREGVIAIPLNPFFGILGVAATEPMSSVPPGTHGGNLDNRHLTAGTRLFLPIQVPGALFSIGDGHSAQGDGEVNVTAIETSMNGKIQLILHKSLDVTAPLAETATEIITMGFGETLDQAFENALQQMIKFLEKFVGLSPEDAYVLCSLAVHFHITQVVNQPQKGVHAILSKSLINWGALPG